MALLTKTMPQIQWSPVPFPPLKNFLIKIVIKGGKSKEERGTLKFKAGQLRTPIFVTDSMARDFPRPSNAIFVVWHGAKITQLRVWIEKHIPVVKEKLPLPVRVILIGGGNNLAARHITPSFSPKDMAFCLIKQLEYPIRWGEENSIALTISSVIPRPSKMDEHKSKKPYRN